MSRQSSNDAFFDGSDSNENASFANSSFSAPTAANGAGESIVAPSEPSSVYALAAGSLVAATFYLVLLASQWKALQAYFPMQSLWQWLNRYFLGHPVAIAATVLFCVGLAILGLRYVSIRQQWKLFRRLSDTDLSPNQTLTSPSDQFRARRDAGFVAQHWLADLSSRRFASQGSRLVYRLREVLERQTGRGTTKHLSDDLRELSGRDMDAAHDSFALVRIIVWAIPMLGFLGTVIGITQTLGGLDFSDGNAAVDNLKSGLYVAFDTTALGLVLSVIAIFLQFPVERSEQELLAGIDEKVARLTGLSLPGDDAADNQFELLAQLCEGVRAAVAESLDNQTKLWRETIDEAQSYWQDAHKTQADSIVTAVEETLTPALKDHAGQLDRASIRNNEALDSRFQNWQKQLSLWQETIVAGAEAMTEQHATMLDQAEQAALVREQATSVLDLQKTLAANLDILDETNQRIDENLAAASGQGMADAMIVLARAVDVLTDQLANQKAAARTPSNDLPHDTSERRAA